MQSQHPKHRRKSTVRRAPVESEQELCAHLPPYKTMHTASDQVKRTRHQARSSDTQPPSSHRSTHTAEHPMLPPIRTRTAPCPEPPQAQWAGASPAARPPRSSVPDDVFWATIEKLGGRDAVLARLVTDTHWRESATAASLPPVLSLESSQPSTHARESAKAVPNAAPCFGTHSMGRQPDGASSGGEESMDVGDGADAVPRAAGPCSRYVCRGTCAVR